MKNTPKQKPIQKPSTNLKTNTLNGFESAILKPLHYAILAVIVVVTFIVYSPALKGEFVNWDDGGYVVDNTAVHQLDGEHLKGLFKRYDMGNYHPITMLSLAIDYHFAEKLPPEKFGEESKPAPQIFHTTNLILHIFNTLLVFLLIFMLIKRFENSSNSKQSFAIPIALITCALFGLNTMHVESVAWVAERKDVLYTFFYLLALTAYIKFTDERKPLFLILSLLAFILSSLSKGQAVSLAVTTIAVDLLLSRKFDAKTILEKIPYFIIALTFGIVAIFAQKEGEAIHEIGEYGFGLRIVFASFAYIQYLLKSLIPINLAAMYPYPHPFDGDTPKYFYFFPILVAGIIYGLVKAFKNSKEITFAILFYSINIFLLLQFLPVGSAMMADRYSYIPTIGFFFLIAYLFKYLIIKKPQLQNVVVGVVILYCGFLGFRTFQQTKIWNNSLSLWNHTLAVSPRAVVGWNNRGSAKDKVEDKEGAIADFTEAVTLKPDYKHAFYNRGTAYKDLHRYKEALVDFNKALELDPNFLEAYHNRGISRENSGDLKGAIEDYTKALSFDPEKANLYASRGVAKGKMGNLDDAINDFNISISKKAINPEAYSNRGFAKVNQKKYQDGIKDYDIALTMNPESEEPRYNRAIAYLTLGDTVKSLQDYDYLLKINPKHVDGLKNRAFINYQRKEWKKVLADYDVILSVEPNRLEVRNTRAAIRYDLKNWAGVLEDFEIILKQAPNFAEGYYKRAMAKINLSKKSEGCADLDKAASLGYKSAAEARAKYCK